MADKNCMQNLFLGTTDGLRCVLIEGALSDILCNACIYSFHDVPSISTDNVSICGRCLLQTFVHHLIQRYGDDMYTT